MHPLTGEELSALGLWLGGSLSSGGKSAEELNHLGNVLTVAADVILTIAGRRAQLEVQQQVQAANGGNSTNPCPKGAN